MTSSTLPPARYLGRIAPTPLVRLPGPGAQLWLKLEFLNPSGSTKDRIARHILEKAWRRGELRAGSTVVEASSGSTSIALALACAQLGLRFVAFIPGSATNERSLMIQAYGGSVRRVDGGMPEVIAAAEAFAHETGAFAARQFENLDNVEAHRIHTAAEILAQLDELRVDAVISGVGTGGTLRGLWEGFHAAGCRTQPVAAIPRTASDFAGNPECCSLCFSSKVPGVVENCSKLYAEWKAAGVAADLEELAVDDNECLTATHRLWKQGYPVGPSSGLNLVAAERVAARLAPEAVVVTVLPDRMERYFSHAVFEALR